MPSRRPVLARDDISPEDQRALMAFLRTKLSGDDLAQAEQMLRDPTGMSEPPAMDDDASAIDRMKAALKAMGTSDAEIEAICKGTGPAGALDGDDELEALCQKFKDEGASYAMITKVMSFLKPPMAGDVPPPTPGTPKPPGEETVSKQAMDAEPGHLCGEIHRGAVEPRIAPAF